MSVASNAPSVKEPVMTRQLSNTARFAFASFSFIVLATMATGANADTYSHIDQIANRIQNRANQIVNETGHYVHTPQYQHLRSDALAVAELAEHIHELAHHHGSAAHLASDLAELDAEFHHLESLFHQIEISAAYGHGHVHGNTNNVRRLLDRIEDDIHHLQTDIASLRTVTRRPVIYAPVPVVPAYTQPRVYSGPGGHGCSGSQRTITIGGRSSQFTFRF